MSMLARLSLPVLLLLTTACQSFSGLEAPEVSLSSLRLESVGVFEQRWQAVLRARNPNDRAVTIKALDYEILVNGERLARGNNNEAITLPALDDVLITTSVSTSLLGTLQQLQRLQRLLGTLQQLQRLQQNAGEPLNYQLKGSARVAGLAFPIHFDREGEFTLPMGTPPAQ